MPLLIQELTLRDLSQNSFGGDFPNELFQFSALTSISLAALVIEGGLPNGVGGTISEDIANLTNIEIL